MDMNTRLFIVLGEPPRRGLLTPPDRRGLPPSTDRKLPFPPGLKGLPKPPPFPGLAALGLPNNPVVPGERGAEPCDGDWVALPVGLLACPPWPAVLAIAVN